MFEEESNKIKMNEPVKQKSERRISRQQGHHAKLYSDLPPRNKWDIVVVVSFIYISFLSPTGIKVTPCQQNNSNSNNKKVCTSGGVVYLVTVFTRMPGESYRRQLRSLLL